MGSAHPGGFEGTTPDRAARWPTTGSIARPLPATIGPATPLDVAVECMRRSGLTLLPVTGPRGELLGVLRQWELFRLVSAGRWSTDADRPAPLPGSLPGMSHSGLPTFPSSGLSKYVVAEVMAAQPLSIDHAASVWEAKRRMDEWGVSCLPVTAAGVVVGLVTSVLVLRAILQGAEPPGPDRPFRSG